MNPPDELPETFKGMTRHSVGEIYVYNVRNFAWINARYHQSGFRDGKPTALPGVWDPAAAFYEIDLTYNGSKPLTIFSYSPREVAEALNRCWEELGFQLRLNLMTVQSKLEAYEAIDVGHDERGFWQRLDNS